MDSFSNEVSGIVVSIIALSIMAAVALAFVVGGVLFGALTGGTLGMGVVGYRSYRKRKPGPWEERGDASGTGLFEPGGVFLGEQEVPWQ